MQKIKKTLKIKDVSMATASDVKEITGYTIGGVSPVGHLNKVVILIDILYEKKSKIYIRSEKKLLEMFDVKKSLIPFQRTVSRISEMTSKQWGNN